MKDQKKTKAAVKDDAAEAATAEIKGPMQAAENLHTVRITSQKASRRYAKGLTVKGLGQTAAKNCPIKASKTKKANQCGW